MTNCDLIVVDPGPAGHRAAVQAAKLGKRVAVLEMSHVAGGGHPERHAGVVPEERLQLPDARLVLQGRRARLRQHARMTRPKGGTTP